MQEVITVFAEMKTSLLSQLGIATLSNFMPALIVLLIALVAIKIIMRIVKKTIVKFEIEKSLHTFIISKNIRLRIQLLPQPNVILFLVLILQITQS